MLFSNWELNESGLIIIIKKWEWKKNIQKYTIMYCIDVLYPFWHSVFLWLLSDWIFSGHYEFCAFTLNKIICTVLVSLSLQCIAFMNRQNSIVQPLYIYKYNWVVLCIQEQCWERREKQFSSLKTSWKSTALLAQNSDQQKRNQVLHLLPGNCKMKGGSLSCCASMCLSASWTESVWYINDVLVTWFNWGLNFYQSLKDFILHHSLILISEKEIRYGFSFWGCVAQI